MNFTQALMIGFSLGVLAWTAWYLGWRLGTARGYHEGMATQHNAAKRAGFLEGERAGYERAENNQKASTMAGELSAGVQGGHDVPSPQNLQWPLWQHMNSAHKLSLTIGELAAIERAAMRCMASRAIKNLKGDS